MLGDIFRPLAAGCNTVVIPDAIALIMKLLHDRQDLCRIFMRVTDENIILISLIGNKRSLLHSYLPKIGLHETAPSSFRLSYLRAGKNCAFIGVVSMERILRLFGQRSAVKLVIDPSDLRVFM